MKQKFLTSTLCVLMGMTMASCGKEAKENKSQKNDSVVTGSSTNLIEEKFNLLQTAVIKNDSNEVRRILALRESLDLNKKLDDGETLLTYSISKNFSTIVELLIEYNASLFRTNNKKETPLMVASKLGHEGLVRLLISSGAKTDSKDENGNTSLHLAIINRFENVALYLINNNANFDITNNADQTALKLAELNDLKKVISLLRSLTQSVVGLPEKTTVFSLLTLGDIQSLNQIITKYPTIIHEYKDLNFFVQVLRSHSHDTALRMMLLLLGYGADIDGPANAESTALIESIKLNDSNGSYEDIVLYILKERANPNLLDSDNKSALIWAIQKNSPSIVKALLDKQAAERYTYTVNGKKKTMKACDVAREQKKKVSTSQEKKNNEEILDLLGCGLRWLF